MRKSTHYPNLVNAYELARWLDTSGGQAAAGITDPDGRHVWVPARAIGFCSIWSSMRLAWGVFRGRYDALVWPGQGDDR